MASINSVRFALMPMSWKATANSSASTKPLSSSSIASKHPRILTTSSGGSSTCFRGLSDLVLDFRSLRLKFRDWRATIRLPLHLVSTSSSISRPPCSASSSTVRGSFRVSLLSASKPKETMLPSLMLSSMCVTRSSMETTPSNRSADRATSGRPDQTSATLLATTPRPRRSISCLNSSPPVSAIESNAPTRSLVTSLCLFQCCNISMASLTIRLRFAAQAACLADQLAASNENLAATEGLLVLDGTFTGACSSFRASSWAQAAASCFRAWDRATASMAFASSLKRCKSSFPCELMFPR
mmetsp:Transcript_56575/g.143142  ORF Transcript_56575/g.143142 Transcript_56575/m.143142 type:complete len:298 (-) Transcript_56575:520-1413(-)